MKRYLITGGAGFIGANFVKYLYEVEENPQVVVLDKLTYSGNLDNLADVADREGFTFVKGISAIRRRWNPLWMESAQS